MMSCYQKFYTNHIHSSSLLCQLATMWKSQVLCDAIIRTGNIITKAHRVVLVAACPMLQSMENASMGSHLEVRLASDIKQDSVHTFLQYLYEGYMMLTEENCKDVEKIARLLQVDSVIKCISDFYKCLSAKTGCVIDDRYKYSSFDLMEFKHVRSSSIQKTLPETALKRGSELNRPSSPGHKRQRLGRPSSPLMRSSQRADDTLSMAHSYGGSHGSREPWDQGGRLGGRVPPQPGVIDIVEDSIEIIQTDRNEKDPLRSDGRMKQKSVSIAVTSQYNTPTDLQVVSMGDPDGVSSNSTQQTSEMLHNSSSQGSITVSPIPLFSDTSSTSAHTKPPDIQQEMPSVRPNIPPSQPVFPTLTPMHRPPHSSSSKPFAAGSASQSFISSSPQSRKADTLPSSNTNQDHKGENNSNDSNTPSTSADKAPDITIVKVESNTDHNTEGLDMYVDMPDDGIMRLQGMDDSQNDEGSDIEHVEQDQSADWSKEDMSNEGSNLGIDQNNSWYIDQFKEWLLSQGEDPNFETLSPSRLNTILCKYYQTMSSESSPMLTFFALELTRHLTGPPYYRDINIMSNPEFDASNRILNLNERQKKQKVFPVGNICDIPASISFTHLQQLYLNEHLSGNDQYSLQNKVWLDINVYFGGFTRQLLRDMRKSSFVLYNDDDEGRRYYRLQDDRIAFTDTRMYEQPGSPYCPITSMLRYISYLNPDTDVLFQQPCSHEDVVRNGNWYSIQPIGKNQHSAKLSSLCKHIGVKCQFRNTSVRHLSRHIQSIYSDQTPAYSDRIFRILTGVEEDPLIWTDGSYVHQKRK